MKQFAVIGLGRFGVSLAKELYALGHDVFAIDLNEERIQHIAPHVTSAVQADAGDLAAPQNVGHQQCGYIICNAGTISALRCSSHSTPELGIPEIYAKAYSTHAKILRKLGVTKVYMPEIEMGQRIARELSYADLLELIELDPEKRNRRNAQSYAVGKQNHRPAQRAPQIRYNHLVDTERRTPDSVLPHRSKLFTPMAS